MNFSSNFWRTSPLNIAAPSQYLAARQNQADSLQSFCATWLTRTGDDVSSRLHPPCHRRAEHSSTLPSLETRSLSPSRHRPPLQSTAAPRRVALPHRPLRPTDAIAPLSSPEHSREAPLTLLSSTEYHTALSFFCLKWKSTDELHCPTPPPSRIHAIPSIILQLTSPTPSLSIHKLVLSNSELARALPTSADDFFFPRRRPSPWTGQPSAPPRRGSPL